MNGHESNSRLKDFMNHHPPYILGKNWKSYIRHRNDGFEKLMPGFFWITLFCFNIVKPIQNQSNLIFLSISFLYDWRCAVYSDISTSNTDFAKFEKLKDKFSWFYSNYDMIEKDIRNQYVAVKDRNTLIMMSALRLL